MKSPSAALTYNAVRASCRRAWLCSSSKLQLYSATQASLFNSTTVRTTEPCVLKERRREPLVHVDPYQRRPVVIFELRILLRFASAEEIKPTLCGINICSSSRSNSAIAETSLQHQYCSCDFEFHSVLHASVRKEARLVKLWLHFIVQNNFVQVDLYQAPPLPTLCNTSIQF